MNTIDCRGLQCPEPVIRTKKYFDSVEAGKTVIIVDNETAKNNIIKYAGSSNLKYTVEEKEGLYYLILAKGEADSEEQPAVLMEEGKTLTIVVTSDKLGAGDDSLGILLMKSYLYALSENDSIPANLIFLNSGVRLTAEGSQNIENLKKLQEKGTEIISCGTCLDFYGLKEKLLVGEIGNMYDIVHKMNSSDNTIKL